MSKIVLKDVTLSFPSLWDFEEYNGESTGKYAGTFLIPKDSPQFPAIKKAVMDMAIEKWGKPVPKGVKYCINDGDEKDYDGFADHWTIKASTKKRPVVVDRTKAAVTESDDVAYSGCLVNASISFWCQDNNYGKRVNASLNGIQVVGAGTPYGGTDAGGLNDFDAIDAPITDGTSDSFDDDDIPF